MGVYDRSAAAAIRMIARKGSPVTWVKPGQTIIPDPDKPWIKEETPEQEFKNIKMVLLPSDSSLLKSIALMLNKDIVAGNIVGYMGRVPFNPVRKDKVIRRDGSVLVLNDFKVYQPNDEAPVLYVLDFVE